MCWKSEASSFHGEKAQEFRIQDSPRLCSISLFIWLFLNCILANKTSYAYCNFLTSVSHFSKLSNQKRKWEPPRCTVDWRMHGHVGPHWLMRWPEERRPCVVLYCGGMTWCLDHSCTADSLRMDQMEKCKAFWMKALSQDFLLGRRWITAHALGHFIDKCPATCSRKTSGCSGDARKGDLDASWDVCRWNTTNTCGHPGRALTGCQWGHFIFKISPVTIPEGIL